MWKLLKKKSSSADVDATVSAAESIPNARRSFLSRSSTPSNASNSSNLNILASKAPSTSRQVPLKNKESTRIIQDAGMEREISNAARRLGEDIQKVVMNAKLGNQAKKLGSDTSSRNKPSWNDDLLRILGGSDETEDNDNTLMKSDIEILLKDSHCDKFLLRCMENELPPNLIHCLRLLRVLEMNNVNDSKAVQNDSLESKSEIKPVSRKAIENVKRLMILLCSDQSVGEQLRPHLFGLLALSGARYPINAVHIAKAVSDIIVAFSRECLSSTLIRFLCERRMIVHMTDDVKELVGMTNIPDSVHNSSIDGLYGVDAEKHGMWASAIAPIISLVKESCVCGSRDLLNDFETAGGYHVLFYTMINGGKDTLSQILDFVSRLMTCDVKEMDDLSLDTEDDLIGENTEDDLESSEMLVNNIEAFQVVVNIMQKSIPFLVKYSGPEHIASSIDAIRSACMLSVKMTKDIFFEGYPESITIIQDSNIISPEILLTLMKLFSSHPENFDIIEDRFDVLTKFLLSYPTFTNAEVKHLIRRILEYVCTGIPNADYSKVFSTASEMFFSICKSLLKLSIISEDSERGTELISIFVEDTRNLCDTIEKLLQVDDSFAQLIIESGTTKDFFNEALPILLLVSQDGGQEAVSQGFDTAYGSICKILDHIVKCSLTELLRPVPQASSPIRSPTSYSSSGNQNIELDTFLMTGITCLTPSTCRAALRVLEHRMELEDEEYLEYDMGFIIKILNDTLKDIGNANSELSDDAIYGKISICSEILQMLQRILYSMDTVQDIFRNKSGFETLLQLLICLEVNEIPILSTKDDEIFKLITSLFGVISSATSASSKDQEQYSSVKEVLSTNIEYNNASSRNRAHLAANGFYESLVRTISAAGFLKNLECALGITNLSLRLLNSKLEITSIEENITLEIPCDQITTLKNPGAIRLVLGLSIVCCDRIELKVLAQNIMDLLIELCEIKFAGGATLEQLANIDICHCLLTDEFYTCIFEDSRHCLHDYFVQLLVKLASFKISYMDFVALLRFIARPLFETLGFSSRLDGTALQLPVLSASRTEILNVDTKVDKTSDTNICLKLKILALIAKQGDRVPRCQLGGCSLNDIASFIQSDIGLDEKLYKLADLGKIKFIEIETIQDRSANTNTETSSSESILWSPSVSTGFSFSAWVRLPDSDEILDGNLCVFDISSNIYGSHRKVSAGKPEFISIWYDFRSKGFNIISSASSKPLSFPVSILSPGMWHHILITYQPPKRTAVLSRKAIIGLCIDGKPLEVDIKIDAVPLRPSSSVYIGVPNPMLASSGIIRGALPSWDLGSSLLVSKILGPKDALAIFAVGPKFHGQFWGDRPLRTSVSAVATSLFSVLAETSSNMSLSLEKRSIEDLEGASHITRNNVFDKYSGTDPVHLDAAGLYLKLHPDSIICALHATSSSNLFQDASIVARRSKYARRLVNVAKINSNNDCVSSDAIAYGVGCIIEPACFTEMVTWAGGVNLLLPMVNAAQSREVLTLTLQIIRECTFRNIPNLESFHTAGCRMLALLLDQKAYVSNELLDHFFAFSVHGLDPLQYMSLSSPSWSSSGWVLSDLDAFKYILMNHQVWDMHSSGPEISLRFISLLNCLVSNSSRHSIFNARRLHLLGMVRWTVHFMIEVSELYSYGSLGEKLSAEFELRALNDHVSSAMSAFENGWLEKTLAIKTTSVGGDPGIPLLHSCKNLLNGILSHIITPEDFKIIADTVIFCSSIDGMYDDLCGQFGYESEFEKANNGCGENLLSIGSVLRIYLLRLLEEIVVNGICENFEISKIDDPTESFDLEDKKHEKINMNENFRERQKSPQEFPQTFALILSPAWFARVLESCRDEASAATAFRLLTILLQNSTEFAQNFEDNGGFAPLVMSIPKFSTSASITLAMLSQLLHAPLMHLPCFASLEADQLCAIFDSESDANFLLTACTKRLEGRESSVSTTGIFALVAECLSRNIQLSAAENSLGHRAKKSNAAVFRLLIDRHSKSQYFQTFCQSQAFLEPLAQALCLVHNNRLMDSRIKNICEISVHPQTPEEKVEGNRRCDEFHAFCDGPRENDMVTSSTGSNGDSSVSSNHESDSLSASGNRRQFLQSPLSLKSATERFVGKDDDDCAFGLVTLLNRTVSHAVFSMPKAADLVAALFHSFPIHARVEEVEAFHMVLIEQCHTIIEEALLKGPVLAIANCVGVCSVFLQRLFMGFFTAEPILKCFYSILSVLHAVSKGDSVAAQLLREEDPEFIIRSNAAHYARLFCLGVLKRTFSSDSDTHDEMFQQRIIIGISNSLKFLLFAPTTSNMLKKKKNHSIPMPDTKQYRLWESTNMCRCLWGESCKIPEISEISVPDRAFVVSLLSLLYPVLKGENKASREEIAQLLKNILVERKGVATDLLIQDIPLEVGSSRTIDLINDGGFGSLLMHKVDQESLDNSIEHMRLRTFFDWLEVNQKEIQEVFSRIESEASNTFISVFGETLQSPEKAIEREQKDLLMKIALKGSVENQIVMNSMTRDITGPQIIDFITLDHMEWKNQGMSDLSSGFQQWKSLLRQLKGSYSIWEGSNRVSTEYSLSREALLNPMKSLPGAVSDLKDGNFLVDHWKLDITEGYEGQRKKLIPNYEFCSLYDTDHFNDTKAISSDLDKSHESSENENDTSGLLINMNLEEATPDLLKMMDLGKAKIDDEFEIDDNDDIYDDINIASRTLDDDEVLSPVNNQWIDTESLESTEYSREDGFDDHGQNHLIEGLLDPRDRENIKYYNIIRCTGLEVCKALLCCCRHAIYVIDGFEQDEKISGLIKSVDRGKSAWAFNVQIQQRDSNVLKRSKSKDEDRKKLEQHRDPSRYQHRCKKLAHDELYAIYKRRYHLQPIALEFYDNHNNGTLIAFEHENERDEVLDALLNTSLPNSIFNFGAGITPNYDKFIKSLRSKIISQWVQGKMTNFDFLMHLNSFAGRSYNDLTQYPVFPWVIADYESDEIDLKNPNIYRDLSQPMGALGLARAAQFRERFESLQSNYARNDEPPPFHYGTHYSCAAYVLNYLLRLEPFSRLAISIQGGKFDLADRLFNDIGASWRSASRDNLQDVRELIPEFYYLPEFLQNKNAFDFGKKQDGSSVNDVILPPWAKGDPKRFVRINRQALESDFVSKNLHKWVDLIFGYKQRGTEAVKAQNTFVHVTYEGAVDINGIEDPVQKASIISQIQNFGQTPSRLERKPFPAKSVMNPIKDAKSIDWSSLQILETLTPPFCIVGAPHAVHLRVVQNETCKVGMSGQHDSSVGDLCLIKGQLVGVGKDCVLVPNSKKYFRSGGFNNGISSHVSATSTRNWELNKVLSIHDDMHRAPITAMKSSRDSNWLVTGCMDSTVRVWKVKHNDNSLKLHATLCGHNGRKITCVDISTTFGTIVTGDDNGSVLLWDLRTLSFLRKLGDHSTANCRLYDSVISVGLNDKTGDILILVGMNVTIFDINGNRIATFDEEHQFTEKNRPTCAISTDCQEWMENGISAVTGHMNGDVILWSIDRDAGKLVLRHVIGPKVHTCMVTCLKIEGKRQDQLLSGDKSGRMSYSKTIQLETLNSSDLAIIMQGQ